MATGIQQLLFNINKKGLTNQDAPQRGTPDFLAYAAKNDGHPPSYWRGRQNVPIFRFTSYNYGGKDNLVATGPKSRSAITNLIVQTYDSNSVGLGRDARGLGSCNIDVLSVERLENHSLFSLYSQSSTRGKPFPRVRKLPGSSGRIRTMELLPNFMKEELYWEVNEQYLFHGTKEYNIQSILSNGLDLSKGSLHAMFGQAVYTAESFTKSDQYTDLLSARSLLGTELYMILARFLLGRVYVCTSSQETHNLHGPPCTSCHVHACGCLSPNRFDSVMADGGWAFREFVVHQKNRCYPEYIIKYKRT